MKEFNIKITDTDVYINGKLQYCSCPMDKENHEDDLNKRALLALADVMQSSCLKKWHRDSMRCLMKLMRRTFDITNEEKRWNELPDIDNETVKIWLAALLEATNKMLLEELTADEIKAEIEETKGSIRIFSIWRDKHSIIDFEEYIEVLEEMLNNKEEN